MSSKKKKEKIIQAASNATPVSMLVEKYKSKMVLNRKEIPFTKMKSPIKLDLKLLPGFSFPPAPIMAF